MTDGGNIDDIYRRKIFANYTDSKQIQAVKWKMAPASLIINNHCQTARYF